MTTDQMKTKPRRRWLQFSLRTMLVLMLAFGCGFGWLAYQIKQARQQREAANVIEKLGGTIDWDPTSGGMIRTAMAWVGKLLGQDLFVDVRSVYLDNTPVTDAGLEHLRGLRQLQVLDLDNTQVTDAGLEHLRGLTQLRWLYLDNIGVTDAGVKQLRGLTQLERLSLDDTQVTDAGLVHLRGLTKLEWLDVSNTKVTDAGVAKLQKALPNVQIFR